MLFCNRFQTIFAKLWIFNLSFFFNDFPCRYLAADVSSRLWEDDFKSKSSVDGDAVDITEEVRSPPKGCLLNPIDQKQLSLN
jgi:hypothetical protein